MQFNQLFELSSRKKLAIALTWDCFALVCASVFAFWIRLGIARWDFTQSDAVAIALNVVLALVLLALFGHYQQMIRYIGQKAIQKAVMVLALSALVLLAQRLALDVMIPISVPIIYWAVSYCL